MFEFTVKKNMTEGQMDRTALDFLLDELHEYIFHKPAINY